MLFLDLRGKKKKQYMVQACIVSKEILQQRLLTMTRDSSKGFLVSAACNKGNVVFGSPREEKHKYMVQACIVFRPGTLLRDFWSALLSKTGMLFLDLRGKKKQVSRALRAKPATVPFFQMN